MKEERFEQILSILEKEKYVSVSALSEALYVSMPTIRRDLAEMQTLNLVNRCRGGVMRMPDDFFGSPLIFRQNVNQTEKRKLARLAANLLTDDITIFLDESSSTFHVIDELDKFSNIRVITNSLPVTLALKSMNVTTFCLGGEFYHENSAFGGSLAEEMVDNFGIDIVFFSSSGINSKGMIVDFNDKSNSLRKRVIRQADTKVFICDKTKIGKSGSYVLMPLSKVDYLVTNGVLPANIDIDNAKIMSTL